MSAIATFSTDAPAKPLLRPSADMNSRATAVLQFWFGPDHATAPWGHINKTHSEKWYGGSPQLDQEIREQFGADLEALASGKLDNWQQPHELLAKVILSDQFTRNAYRGSGRMFSLDATALQTADALVDSEDFGKLQPCEQNFALMPYMHAEDMAHHEKLDRTASSLLAGLPEGEEAEAARGLFEGLLKYGRAHADVIRKWGRYPHRNVLLDRQSTPEEEAGLADGSIGAW